MDRGTGFTHRCGGSARAEKGEKMERLTEFPDGEDAQSPTVFELNLTVIDLHVLRSAVHLINVVADFF